jgi:hypothetical protein
MTTKKEEVDKTARVLAVARDTARLFVNEFNEPLDPDETDWDATAWCDDLREAGLSEEEADKFWDVYQAELVAETERLCSEVGA